MTWKADLEDWSYKQIEKHWNRLSPRAQYAYNSFFEPVKPPVADDVIAAAYEELKIAGLIEKRGRYLYKTPYGNLVGQWRYYLKVQELQRNGGA